MLFDISIKQFIEDQILETISINNEEDSITLTALDIRGRAKNYNVVSIKDFDRSNCLLLELHPEVGTNFILTVKREEDYCIEVYKLIESLNGMICRGFTTETDYPSIFIRINGGISEKAGDIDLFFHKGKGVYGVVKKRWAFSRLYLNVLKEPITLTIEDIADIAEYNIQILKTHEFCSNLFNVENEIQKERKFLN